MVCMKLSDGLWRFGFISYLHCRGSTSHGEVFSVTRGSSPEKWLEKVPKKSWTFPSLVELNQSHGKQLSSFPVAFYAVLLRLLPFLRETLHHRSSQSQHGANGISNFQHVVFSFHVCFDQGSIDSTSNCCQCYLPPQKKQTFEPQLGTGSNSQIVATQRTTSFLKMPMQTVAMTVIQHPRKK